MREAADSNMTFGEFVQAYTRDMKLKLVWYLRRCLFPYMHNRELFFQQDGIFCGMVAVRVDIKA